MHYLLMFIQLLLFGTSVAFGNEANSLTEPDSRDNSEGCQCYLVSGPDFGYFQHYRFWDFRSVPSDGTNDYSIAPPLITSLENEGGQNVTSDFFNTASFNNDWSIENAVEEANAAVPSINSAQNVYISRGTDGNGSESTYLTLRAFRLPEFVSIAEVDSNQKNVLHGSIRARIRLIPAFSNASEPFVSSGTDAIDGLNTTHPIAPGAVLGFFTYQSDKQESDIEILTSDPITNIRYSNQPDFDPKIGNTIPGASTDTVLPNGKVWTEWHDHRIDWYDGVSRWYIDGEMVLEKTMNVPTKPSGLVLNLWSDGGEWSGNMSVGAQVIAGIEWIEMAFNTSGKVTGPQKRHQHICDVGCNVDHVQEIGFPLVAFNVTGSESGGSGRGAVVEIELAVLTGLCIVHYLMDFLL